MAAATHNDRDQRHATRNRILLALAASLASIALLYAAAWALLHAAIANAI